MTDSTTDRTGDAIPSIDSARFWYALGGRATGAAVIATASGRDRAGFFALSVTHLAQDPPTVIVTVGNRTSALSTLVKAGCFSVNYLAAGQVEMIDLFSGKAGAEGAARFVPGLWSAGISGAPILEGAAGVVDCVVEELIRRYDVTIAIGRIVDYVADPDAAPLVFHMGKARPLGN